MITMIVKTADGTYEYRPQGECDDSTRDYKDVVLELYARMDEVENLLDSALRVLWKQDKKLRKLKAKLS